MDTSSASVLPAVLALVGAAIGAVAGVGGTLGLEVMRRRQERRSIASSFAAVIGHIADNLRSGEAACGAEAVAKAIAEGAPFTRPTSRRPPAQTLIYDRNVDRIGILGPALARRVVAFFTAWQAALGKWEILKPSSNDAERLETAQTLREIAVLYRSVFTIGDGLADDLMRFARLEPSREPPLRPPAPLPAAHQR